MAATHRAPKQWQLTRSETINSFENWKQNLTYTLKLDLAFANFFVEGTRWRKRSKKVPHRGFTNHSEQTVGKQTAQEKVATLEMMLGQIANYCPVISRNSILNATSLPEIWQMSRLHYGFQANGAHFINLADIKLLPDESPEDLYQRLMAFIEDNLLWKDGSITHHGDTPDEDEELSPSLENFIVHQWLTLVHHELPRIVKQWYGTELRSHTLASIRPEISQAISSLLEEVRASDEARSMCTVAEQPRYRNTSSLTYNTRKGKGRRTQQRKSCPICLAAKRSDDHWIYEQVPCPARIW